MASACGKWQSESRRFCALCNLNHTTRANIAHEKAEQIRARIACTPAEKEWRGRGWSKCADGTESVLFIFSIDYTWVLSCRGIDTYAKHVCRRRRDGSQSVPLFVLFVLFGQAKRTLKEKYHKETFLLSYFSVTKSTKSHLRGFSILLKISFRVPESVARAVRGECVRQRTERKSIVSHSPQSQPYHACEHITRNSRADSCTHCLHAR